MGTQKNSMNKSAGDKPLSPVERAEAASRAIQEALEKFDCVIIPTFDTPEAVGRMGSKILLTARYGIFPKEPTG